MVGYVSQNNIRDGTSYILSDEKPFFVASYRYKHCDKNLPHNHSYFAIELISCGNCTQIINGDEYLCEPGTISLLSPLDNHLYSFYANLEQYYLIFRENMVSEEVWRKITYDKAPFIVNLAPEDFENVKNDFETLRGLVGSTDKYDLFMAKNIISRIVIYILKNAEKSNISPVNNKNDVNNINKVLRYIKTHFKEEITLSEVSAYMNMEYSYFCRFFKKHMGVSFKNYLMDQRLTYIANQLLSTNDTVTEIYTECGFNTESHFYTAFRKKYSVTPEKYRMQHLSKQKGNIGEDI